MVAAAIARLALMIALCVVFAASAVGHAVVVETEPADGAVLAHAPDRVRIVYSEPVSLIAVQLLDATGRVVTAPDATSVNGAVEVGLPSDMAPGTYLLSYRVVSVDGHPVGGSLTFSIGEATALASGASTASAERLWQVAWVVVRAIFDAALLASAGGVLFLLLVAKSSSVAWRTAHITSRVGAAAIAAAVVSIGVQGGLLIDAPFGELASTAVWRIGLTSTFGSSAIVAVGGLALIVAGMQWCAAPGQMIALAGALVALASYAFAGHVVTGASRWLTVPAFLAHVSAVAFWVGSLLPLRLALDEDDAATIVRRFSAVAAVAVGMLVVAGVVIAVVQVRSLDALIATTYGLVLLGKVGLVSGLLCLAAFNKWRLTPLLARRQFGAVRALRRSIAVEIAVVGAILIATAALGTTPPPRALPSGMAEDHSMQHHGHVVEIDLSSGDYRVAVSLAPGETGRNHVEVKIAQDQGEAVSASEVTFIATNVAAGVEPIRRAAVATKPGQWEIHDLLLVPAGAWDIRVEALVSDFEKPMFEGRVQLE
jgi:copper transport protein